MFLNPPSSMHRRIADSVLKSHTFPIAKTDYNIKTIRDERYKGTPIFNLTVKNV